MQSVVEALAQAQIGETFNFYRRGPGAALRRERLARYLEDSVDAPLLLVAEAPGYRGTRVSGIPLTSERQLSGAGPSEATSTIVHRVLAELGLAKLVLLWNIVPTHPHLPGNPASNRRPTRIEVEASRGFVVELARGRSVLPVGRLAESALGLRGIRHPSHGGALAFRTGLMEYAGELALGR